MTNRAQVYRRFARVEESLADLDRAIELAPDFLAARFNRGSIYVSEGRYAEALADFDHCVSTDPDAAAPYFNRAAVRDALGQRSAAVADLERFIALAESESWKKMARDLLEQWSAETAADRP